ncbi:YlbG family protein [Tepidibacillus sp. HK-1]|uniref:YlbG family protein n=1 Tax=Tepidibacillus sp. HK-1 TaxID=1883407 RepID=UPI000852DD93|nr:YlbG family protein [Tepidibacillus sp. HK-1]GBF12556.1 hypothetical protein HK1_02622 [Tepidibacillus sp. HK-1]
MFPKRVGLIVWINDFKAARNLERIGHIHFISKRMNYCILYVNEKDMDKTMAYLQKLSFVKKVERSYRTEIKTDYSSKTVME